MSVLVAMIFGSVATTSAGLYFRKRRELRRLRELLSSGVVCQCGHLECVHTDETGHNDRACRANDHTDQANCACRRFSPLGGLPQLRTRATLELGG